MNRNVVGWFEIYVQNMPRAKAFYEKVLGHTLQHLPMEGMEMWAFPMLPEAGGASGSLVKMEGVPSGGNSTMVYFSCEDCAVQAALAEKAGGKVCQPKFSIGEFGFVAMVSDTEGNMIGLHSQS